MFVAFTLACLPDGNIRGCKCVSVVIFYRSPPSSAMCTFISRTSATAFICRANELMNLPPSSNRTNGDEM